MAEPTPEAMDEAGTIDAMIEIIRNPSGRREALARFLDAFAARRLAEKDAEIEGRVDFWKANAELHLAHIAALQAEIAALRAQVEWRPIETAPRIDDRRKKLLLWWPHWCNRPVIGHWTSYHGGWRADEALAADGIPPTHWFPLPAPPDTIPSKGDAE